MMLETLRDAVRVRLGVPENENFYFAQQLDDLLNEALQTISAEGDWSWLQASETIPTVTGTRFYTPNVNWSQTKALSIQGFDAMTYLDLQEVRNWPDDVFDVPMFYTVYLEQLYLAPTPSAVYQLRHDYLRSEPRLIDNTDVPLMPSLYHYSILAMAVHLAHLRAGDLPRAAAAKQEYDAWLKRMEGQKMRTTSTVKVRVRPGRDL